MNDEPELTAEQLLQATSRVLPPDTALDARTAALRDGFLDLGRAVEAAAGDFDEAALVAKLTSACSGAEVRPQERRSWIPLVLAAALAASALVAIVRTAAVWPAATVAGTAPPGSGGSEALAKSATTPGGALDNARLLAWSDPLDEEIASAEAAFGKLTGRSSGLDGSLESFGSRLEALAAELDGGAL